MNIIMYRYGSICEPDMIEAFKMAGLNVIEEKTEITNKRISAAERVSLVEKHIKASSPVFVFSINFYPAIADICAIYQVPYLCWTVDSPVPELFSQSTLKPFNRIFCFDQAQFDTYSKYNPDCIFHLPLASAVDRFDSVVSSINDKDIASYSCDISFVGSLYTEKDHLSDMSKLPDYSKGFVNGVSEAALKIYGYNLIPGALNDQVVADIKNYMGQNYINIPNPLCGEASLDKYIVAHNYIGFHVAAIERTRTLNALAKYFDVDLYTRSDVSKLDGVNAKGGVQTLTEMPKIFNLSKINLNMTIRPIETGLPLRCFDIMGCGGFLMTNYQSELTDMFEIGVDLEAYSSVEELIDKCAYYLEHEEERAAIAYNGYMKVKNNYTYFHRMKEMLNAVVG